MLAFVFLLSAALAAPLELEVWFISPPGTGALDKFLAPRLTGVKVAQGCEPVGDYCLDPNKGLVPRFQAPEYKRETGFEDSELPSLPVLHGAQRSLVNCEGSYAFDIFCGKAQAEETKAKVSGLEVWIDTSSSMRAVDPPDAQGSCVRAQFMQALMAACEKSPVRFQAFDTVVKPLALGAACVNQGLNDDKRLMDAIEQSTAKKLVVVTDVYEYQADFARFLEGKLAHVVGGKGRFEARQILDFVTPLAKFCPPP